MLTAVKNNLRFLKENIRCGLKSVMEYKKSFLIQSIFMFINNGFFIIFWSTIMNANNGTLVDITMKDIYYLWSVPVLAWGFAFFFFGGTRTLSSKIVTGGLDTYLLQPKNVFLNVISSTKDFSAFGDLIYGALMGIIASDSIKDFLLIIILGIIGAVFFICASAIVRMLSIWIGEMENMAHIYETSLLCTFTNYPEQIFSPIVKGIMFTLVPAMYIAHLPIRILKEFNIKIFLFIILVAMIFIILTSLMFKLVLRKYESSNVVELKD